MLVLCAFLQHLTSKYCFKFETVKQKKREGPLRAKIFKAKIKIRIKF